jgi:hypothetical protein
MKTETKPTRNYEIIISDVTLEKIKKYQRALAAKTIKAGGRLQKKLDASTFPLTKVTIEEFLELLIQTKSPRIFAESEVWGDGRDWNDQEVSILGDVNCTVHVTVFDNGIHKDTRETPIIVHKEPFNSTLLFTPGALLRNDKTGKTSDMEEVLNKDGSLNRDKSYARKLCME